MDSRAVKEYLRREGLLNTYYTEILEKTNNALLDKKFIQEVLKIKEENITDEDKVIKVYDLVCNLYSYYINYFYVENQGDESWRNPDIEQKEERVKDREKTCYELSSILAQGIELLEIDGMYAHIITKKNPNHYKVLLTKPLENIVAFLDPMSGTINGMPDMVNAKQNINVIISGIDIKKDPELKLSSALNKYNEKRIGSMREYGKQFNRIETESVKYFLEVTMDKLREDGLRGYDLIAALKFILENSNIIDEAEEYHKIVHYLIAIKYNDTITSEPKTVDSYIVQFNEENIRWLLDSSTGKIEEIEPELYSKYFKVGLFQESGILNGDDRFK